MDLFVMFSGVLALGRVLNTKATGALHKLKTKVEGAFNSSEFVDWLASIAFEFAFVGSAVAGYIGDQLHDGYALFVLTPIWFLTLLRLQRILLKRKAYLDELAARAMANEQRRKSAGLIRSIVRSELIRASALDKDEWRD